MPVKIFFCYSHRDEDFLDKLKTHLSPLQWQSLIDPWHDRDISAGTEWEEEIKEHLNTAQIIILLVSPDFMASKYCYSIEMKRAVERHEHKEARVIPIVLRHIYWQAAPFGKLQALPKDGKPVKSWPDQDEAFFNVAEGIRKVVMELTAPPAAVSPAVPSEREQEIATSSDLISAVQQRDSVSPMTALSDSPTVPSEREQETSNEEFLNWIKLASFRPKKYKGTTCHGFVKIGSIEAVTLSEADQLKDEKSIILGESIQCTLSVPGSYKSISHCFASDSIADLLLAVTNEDLVEVEVKCLGSLYVYRGDGSLILGDEPLALLVLDAKVRQNITQL